MGYVRYLNDEGDEVHATEVCKDKEPLHKPDDAVYRGLIVDGSFQGSGPNANGYVSRIEMLPEK